MFRRVTLSVPALVLGAFIFAITSASVAQEGKDDKKKETPPPGEIGFYAENKVAKANGTFHRWKFGKAKFDAENLEESEVRIIVDVSSIDTGIEKRDDHLRNEDFFHVEKYPTAKLTFHSFKAMKDKPGEYAAKLDFDMHGVKKTYENFSFKVSGENPTKVEGKFTFNRMDFKIGEPKTDNPMSITEDIPVTFSVTLPN